VVAPRSSGRALHLWRWALGLPSPVIAILQVAVGTLNLLFVSARLHALLAAFVEVAFSR
jgi:glycosyltransferase 2 family protein